MKFAGIILCGGRSSRMGLAKATLPFGPELMLQRVARLLAEAVGPLVVVAAPEQDVFCPPGATLVRDRSEGQGPLEGLRAGLTALTGQADAAYATSCDVPLLAPAFVREMCARLGDYEIAVPREEAFVSARRRVPYERITGDRTAARPAANAAGISLCRSAHAKCAGGRVLRAVDAPLGTLMNCNRPADYLAALAQAGFAPDPEVMAQLRRSET